MKMETEITKDELKRDLRNIIKIAHRLESSISLFDVTSTVQSNNDTLEFMNVLLDSLGTWSKITKDDIKMLTEQINESTN